MLKLLKILKALPLHSMLLLSFTIFAPKLQAEYYFRCCYQYPYLLSYLADTYSCLKKFNSPEFKLDVVFAKNHAEAKEICNRSYPHPNILVKQSVLMASERDILIYKNSLDNSDEFKSLFPEADALNKFKDLIDQKMDIHFALKLIKILPKCSIDDLRKLVASKLDLAKAFYFFEKNPYLDINFLHRLDNKVDLDSIPLFLTLYPDSHLHDILYLKDKGANVENIIKLASKFKNLTIDDELIELSKDTPKVNSILDTTYFLHDMNVNLSDVISLNKGIQVQGYLQSILPLRNIRQVNPNNPPLFQNGPQTEVVKLEKEKVRIPFADYELLKRDFPSLINKSDEEIDEWLIHEFGYISLTQTTQTDVNTEIPLETEKGQHIKKQVYRPKDYKRALVFPFNETFNEKESKPGLMDAKGVGTMNPSIGDHSNGLATLGEVIREFLYQKLVQEIFEHAGVAIRTVESYAIISPGFDVKHYDEERNFKDQTPAGIILRQAHQRNNGKVLDPITAIQFENFFAHYGIDIELNIQGSTLERVICSGASNTSNEILSTKITTPIRKIVDFGHYVVKNEEQLKSDRVLDIDLSKLMRKHHVPPLVWGYDNSADETKTRPKLLWLHAIHDKVSQYSNETAKACLNLPTNQCKAIIKNLFEDMFKEFRANLAAHPISIEDLKNNNFVPLPKDIVQILPLLPPKPLILPSTLIHIKENLKKVEANETNQVD